MRIVVAKHSGFCFGVRRAVSITKRNLDKHNKKNIYSLGSLIHNKGVVNDLSKKGLQIVSDMDRVKRGYVIIPSHGISPKKIKKRKTISLIDATCPFVFKAQVLAKRLVDSGCKLFILGDKNHPEVKGLVGIANGKAKVLKDENGLADFSPKCDKAALISQTTQTMENFENVKKKLLGKKIKKTIIFNTICKDVRERQEEAKKTARKVELVLVIGGKNSANTKRLFQVCKELTDTYHIENEKDIRKAWLKRRKSVGIVTGASTPGSLIGKVKKRIREMEK